jgi:site-specific recombinase XerD
MTPRRPEVDTERHVSTHHPIPAELPTFGRLESMAASWGRSLRAANLSRNTIESYAYAAAQFGAFARDRGMPTDVASITREHVEAFIEHLVGERSAKTARIRYGGLRSFFGFMVDEGEIPASPMANMRPPTVPEVETRVPTETDLRALLDACDGTSFTDRRDNALIRVFVDTGARLSEVTNLRHHGDDDGSDVDLDGGVVRVLGKGRRFRLAAIAPKTVKAVDRYLRRRSGHPFADDPALWIGTQGTDDDVGRPADDRTSGHRRRDRTVAPAPVPAFRRPLDARPGRERIRRDATPWMALPRDDPPLRVHDGVRTRHRRAPAVLARRAVLTRPVLVYHRL